MPDGFKIAEAYVEIHARMNSRAVQREIEKGLNDAGLDKAGRDAGDKISAGIREKVGAAASKAGDSIKKAMDDAGDDSGKKLSQHADGFVNTFKQVGTSIGKVFADMFNIRSPYLALAAIAAGFVLLPIAAAAVSSAIVLIFGGAFASIGLAASLFEENVQLHFRRMWLHIKQVAGQISTPFEEVWHEVADEAQETFDALAPTLQATFAKLKPHFSNFVDGVGQAFRNLEPMIGPVTDAFGVILDRFEDRLPTLFANIAENVTMMSRAIEDNPGAVDLFIDTLENVITVVSRAITEFTKLAGWIKENEELIGALQFAYNLAINPMGNVTSEMGKFRDESGNVVENMPSVSDAFDMATSAIQKTADTVSGLVKNLDELAKANLSNEKAAVKFDKSILDLQAQLSDGNVSLDTMTVKGNENKKKLLEMAQAANDAKDAYFKNGMEQDQVREKSIKMREEMIKTAVNGFGFSRQEAEKLIDRYFAVPDKVETDVKQPGMDPAQKKADELKKKIDNIPKSHNTNITATDNASNVIANISRTLAGVAAQLALSITAAMQSADGNIFTFANGGENHVAQIANGGPIRMWNEPETGGEAYIPFSPAKRPRSEMILGEVARRFGLTLARPMADGGIIAAVNGLSGFGRSGGTTISSMTVNVNLKGIWDFSDPAKVRALAGAIAPAIREAIRIDERRYAT